ADREWPRARRRPESNGGHPSRTGYGTGGRPSLSGVLTRLPRASQEPTRSAAFSQVPRRDPRPRNLTPHAPAWDRSADGEARDVPATRGADGANRANGPPRTESGLRWAARDGRRTRGRAAGRRGGPGQVGLEPAGPAGFPRCR